MQSRSHYLLNLIACLAVLLGACGLGVIGSAFAPEEAELNLEEAEITESVDPILARSGQEFRPRTQWSRGNDLAASRPLAARESALRGAPPRDAWERPRRW